MSISTITGQQQLRNARAVAALRTNALGSASAPATPGRQADVVSLSDAARSIAAANQVVGTSTDIREDRVSALKASIAAGTYTVNSRALAKSITGTLGR